MTCFKINENLPYVNTNYKRVYIKICNLLVFIVSVDFFCNVLIGHDEWEVCSMEVARCRRMIDEF